MEDQRLCYLEPHTCSLPHQTLPTSRAFVLAVWVFQGVAKGRIFVILVVWGLLLRVLLLCGARGRHLLRRVLRCEGLLPD